MASLIVPSYFGHRVDIPMPAGCDAVVVGYHKLQFRPQLIRLPHQLYVADLRRMLQENGSRDALFAPVNTLHYFTVSASVLNG